jgi:hypothetical protein
MFVYELKESSKPQISSLKHQEENPISHLKISVILIFLGI